MQVIAESLSTYREDPGAGASAQSLLYICAELAMHEHARANTKEAEGCFERTICAAFRGGLLPALMAEVTHPERSKTPGILPYMARTIGVLTAGLTFCRVCCRILKPVP